MPESQEIRIIFREWELVADKAGTKKVYDTVEAGSPEGCTCTPCKKFIANRDRAYPDEIKQLLSDLGIDYKKEAEISHYCRLDNGFHYYGGWFHFKGRFIGGNCSVQDADHNGGGMQTITENFGIGFHHGNFMSFFDDKEQLVQVEFEAKIPWTIDEPESE